MIDFHSHIIPEIDDGARELKESLEMLEEASSAGFDGVISTSHYMENYYEVSQADRKAWLNGLQYGLEEKKIGLSLYLGSEIYFTDKIISLIKEAKASTINGSRYVLFEFPMNAKPINIEDFVYSILSANVRELNFFFLQITFQFLHIQKDIHLHKKSRKLYIN